ncbi:MAG: right-handed parallel beta-helix repeat-containing protein [Pseudomonadales bacterium]
MHVFRAIARLVIVILLISVDSIAQACSIWEDDEGMWHQEDCTLAELTEQIGPEIEYIAVNEAQGLCDVFITQQDLDASLPYVIAQPGIYCVAEDLEVFLESEQELGPAPSDSAIEIQSNRVSLWFLGRDLRNTNTTSADHERGTGVLISGGTDISISNGGIGGFTVGVGKYAYQVGGSIASRQNNIYNIEFNLNLVGLSIDFTIPQHTLIHRNKFGGSRVSIAIAVPNIVINTTNVGIVVQDNDIALDQPMIIGNEAIGIDVWGASNITLENNRIVGDRLLFSSGLSRYYGVKMKSTYNTIIESNVITGMMYGIAFEHGNWGGVDNIVRFNEIYGGAKNSYVPDPNYKVPQSSDGVAGISVEGERDFTLTGNRIYSGRDKGYPTGIEMNNTTFATTFLGSPAFDDNETCGTEDPVSDSNLQGRVATLNQFEVCRNRQVGPSPLKQ